MNKHCRSNVLKQF